METLKSIQDILLWKKDDLDGIRARIRTAIDETEAQGALKKILGENADNAGKMLRPMVMLLAAEGCAPERRDELLWGAAAGEMLHGASLLLDDVIDEAPTRRGKPSVQAGYGTSTAICAGAFLMATAYSCLIDRGFRIVAADLLHVTQFVCAGEQLQDANRWNTEVPEEAYMQSIMGKTAVVFAFCGEIAARISGRDKTVQRVFREFGTALGMIFQLRDDVLDWTMTEKRLGKPAGEDFTNGIYTLPAIHAFRDSSRGKELSALAGKRKQISPEELDTAKELVRQSGGLDYAKGVIVAKKEEALLLLGRLPPSRHRSVLEMLVLDLCRF